MGGLLPPGTTRTWGPGAGAYLALWGNAPRGHFVFWRGARVGAWGRRRCSVQAALYDVAARCLPTRPIRPKALRGSAQTGYS
jgi:hypothetical protein